MSRRGVVLFGGRRAGEIVETDQGFEFAYDSAWLASDDAQPISLTLPLREPAYTSRTMFPFFDGLIPEGWLLAITQRTWKIDARDRMGLLLQACRDPIGAASIVAVEPVDAPESHE